MDKQTAKQLLSVLYEVHENGPSRREYGICYYISPITTEVEKWLYKTFKKWDKFSGDLPHPVPHPTMSPGYAFLDIDNLWDRRTKYGCDRWELLEFLIERLEKELNDENV